MRLTCDIESDRGLIGGIALQVTSESSAVILIDDRMDAHHAAILLVFILQINLSFVPQPHQLFIGVSATLKHTD